MSENGSRSILSPGVIAVPSVCDAPMCCGEQMSAFVHIGTVESDARSFNEPSEGAIMMWACQSCHRTVGATEVDAWVTEYMIDQNPIIWRLVKVFKQ